MEETEKRQTRHRMAQEIHIGHKLFGLVFCGCFYRGTHPKGRAGNARSTCDRCVSFVLYNLDGRGTNGEVRNT